MRRTLKEAFDDARTHIWQPMDGDANTQIFCPMAALKRLRRILTELNQAHIIESWKLDVRGDDNRVLVASVWVSFKFGGALRTTREEWRLW
jgi:hypothetical protein